MQLDTAGVNQLRRDPFGLGWCPKDVREGALIFKGEFGSLSQFGLVSKAPSRRTCSSASVGAIPLV